MGSEILITEDLCAGYEEDLPVIKNINLKVNRGDLVAVVGSNGAGKSTLLKTIYGFLKPFSGKIIYNNLNITGNRPHESKKLGIAYIPQELSPFFSMTVEENLKMGIWTRKNEKFLRDRLEWAYGLFPNLSAKRNHKASSLSGGEIKMLDIARGLMIKPELLLIDEPSVGLSPMMAEEVYRTIQTINNSENITILLVDQNVKRAIEISSYTYYMENGEIKHHASSREITAYVEKIVEASLMGDLIKPD